MLAYLINLFWIIISAMLAVLLVLCVVLFVLLTMYISMKENMKPNDKPVVKLTFDGPSRFEMQHTTNRLLKQDRKAHRKYRRPYF